MISKITKNKKNLPLVCANVFFFIAFYLCCNGTRAIEILPTRLIILQGLHASTTARSDKIAVNSSTNVLAPTVVHWNKTHHFEASEMPNIIPYSHKLFTLLPICNQVKQIQSKKFVRLVTASFSEPRQSTRIHIRKPKQKRRLSLA